MIREARYNSHLLDGVEYNGVPPVVLTGNGRLNQQAGSKRKEVNGEETYPRI